jgi:hypothetical protein
LHSDSTELRIAPMPRADAEIRRADKTCAWEKNAQTQALFDQIKIPPFFCIDTKYCSRSD